MLKGVSFSLFASLLFGLMYYLAIHLRPLSGEGVFGIRMVVTLPFLFLSLFLFKQKKSIHIENRTFYSKYIMIFYSEVK